MVQTAATNRNSVMRPAIRGASSPAHPEHRLAQGLEDHDHRFRPSRPSNATNWGTMSDYEYQQIPTDPSQVPSDSRAWAAAAHLLPFLGLSFIAPLIIWLIKRDEDAFVEEHGREALNFQISIIIYAIVSAILIIVLIGIVLLIVLGIFVLVFQIVAGVKAATGQQYRYPLTIRFVKEPQPLV